MGAESFAGFASFSSVTYRLRTYGTQDRSRLARVLLAMRLERLSEAQYKYGRHLTCSNKTLMKNAIPFPRMIWITTSYGRPNLHNQKYCGRTPLLAKSLSLFASESQAVPTSDDGRSANHIALRL